MTRIIRITATALAALAIVAPVATAMPSDPSIRPHTGTVVSTQTGATDTCAEGSRAVHGPAGIGCTTSPLHNSEDFAVFDAILAGAAAFAVALAALAAGDRRRSRASTAAAFSTRPS